jgi:hypothetical protein
MEVLNWIKGLKVVPSSLRSQRIGGQWRENEVLPENPYSGRTMSRSNVRLVVAQQTYAPESERMVTVWQGNPIFVKCPITSVFLDLELL